MLLLSLLAEEAPAALVLPNWAFPAIAAAVFITLGFVSWSWRDVANRHSEKTGAAGHSASGHSASGHSDAGPGHH